ncbi:tetratricopeptide repeat protein [Luteimonas mephitis]|uniref:tetratricopeptide repeat protein n=1 Tax=Luteimonas mephitis TaxID=83615 RepID=UPI0003FB81A0|nr:VWA domain-containing protein [Luteimonas mephitis]
MNPQALVHAFEALHFLRPQWLWALLVLPLLAWAWRRRRLRNSVWRGAVDAHLLPHLLDRGESRRGVVALCALLLGVGIAVLALAGPSWRQGEQPLLQGEAPLVVALDLSSAMLASDLPPSRLLQARAKLAALLDRRSGGQVGLVVFADDAYTVAPLTRDAGNVALFLDSLAPDVMPVDGSRPARGIEQSVRLLRQAGFTSGDILLIGSQGDAAARDAAADAKRAGFRVSALGLGTPAGAAYRTAKGAIARTRLDAASLRALASAGGGRYEALSAGTGDLVALGVLDASAAERGAVASSKTAVWRDDGYWLLPPLMLLALFAFRRGGGFAVLLLCACLPWHAALAADDGTPWRRADQVRHERMQDGADAYRRGDYAAAAKAWQAIPGADAAYNRGNALAKAGRYEDAIAAYDEALRQQPGMADATSNRALVEAAMKRKPPPSKQPGGRGDQDKRPDSGKPNDGKSSTDEDSGRQSPSPSGTGPRDAQDKSGDGQPHDSDSGQQPPSDDGKTPKPDDAEAQRKADAEQRARMQQALQGEPQKDKRGDDGKPQAGEPAQPPSAAEREKQRANEAWLRRVPDDPGGLLRAKFRLEYERRQQTGEH